MRSNQLAGGLTLVIPASAILVTDGSPCSTLCGNVLDATTADDVVCQSDDYTSNPTGSLFQQCTTCELNSNYHDKSNETDMGAALYNFRYTLSYCFWGIPHNDEVHDNPCITAKACGHFMNATTHKILNPDADEYAYCDIWPVNEEDSFRRCDDCLRIYRKPYLSNFMTMLQGGCEQRPVPGVSVSYDGEIFSTDVVNITEPTPEASIDPSWFDDGPLDTGAIAGIAAAGLVVLLAVAGCFVVWRGKQRRRAFLRSYNSNPLRRRTRGWPSPEENTPVPMKDTSDTPLSQRPLRTWDDSPQSTRSDLPYQRYVSPYSSQYTSPVSASDQAPLPQWPVLGGAEYFQPASAPTPPQGQVQHQQQQGPARNIGVTLSGDDSPVGRDSMAKDTAESYEMQDVDRTGDAGQGVYQTLSHDSQLHYPHTRRYSGSYRNFSGRRDSDI